MLVDTQKLVVPERFSILKRFSSFPTMQTDAQACIGGPKYTKVHYM